MLGTSWTRNDSIRLGEIAYQVGLTPDDADKALTLGARFLAHGFTGGELNEMIRNQYQERARLEKEYDEHTITPSDFRKLREIRGW